MNNILNEKKEIYVLIDKCVLINMLLFIMI